MASLGAHWSLVGHIQLRDVVAKVPGLGFCSRLLGSREGGNLLVRCLVTLVPRIIFPASGPSPKIPVRHHVFLGRGVALRNSIETHGSTRALLALRAGSL